MKKGRVSYGYTIVEVMIVLAVSSALLVAGLLLVNGQQGQAEFNNGSNDIKQQIDQIINTVATGFYQNQGDFTCAASGGFPPTITGVAPGTGNATGTNGGTNAPGSGGCIFVGKAIQFGVNGDDTQYNVYSLAGLQLGPTGKEVQNVSEAKPVAIAPGNSNNTTAPTDSTEVKHLTYGLKIKKLQYNFIAGSPVTVGVIAFITDFAASPSGNLQNGSRSAGLYAINSTAINASDRTTVDVIDAPANITGVSIVKDVSICFDSGTNKYAVVTIGDHGRQLTTELKYVYKSAPTGECT